MYSINNIRLNDSKIPQSSAFKHIFVNNVDQSQDTYLNGENLYFQLENVKLPFGVNYIQTKNNDVKANTPISLGPQCKEFIKFVYDLEKLIISEGFDRSEKWFNQEYTSKDYVKSMFKQSLYHKNKDFPPTITPKIPTNAVLYDENKNVMKLSSFERGMYVDVKLEISGIWISNNKFGISWKVSEMKKKKFVKHKYQNKELTHEYAFNDDE